MSSIAVSLAIDSDFLLICRELGIENPQEGTRHRWEGAAKVATAITRETVGHLIRVAFGVRDVKGKPSVEWFRTEWLQTGLALANTDHERETQLMAAGVLVATFIIKNDVSVRAALEAVT